MTFSPLSRSGSPIQGWQYIDEQYTLYQFPPPVPILGKPQEQHSDYECGSSLPLGWQYIDGHYMLYPFPVPASLPDTAVDKTATVYEFRDLYSPQSQPDHLKRKVGARQEPRTRKLDDMYKPPPRIQDRRVQGLFCRACGVTETGEWRNGPQGRSTLCNACGLSYRKAQESNGRRNYCRLCGKTKETNWEKSPDGLESFCSTCAQAKRNKIDEASNS